MAQSNVPERKKLQTDSILHILRNRWGHSENLIRDAGLDACDEIERLQSENEKLKEYLYEEHNSVLDEYCTDENHGPDNCDICEILNRKE